jgi:uncharacterized protein with von Willebrand factor type A (vWA) domain
MTEPVEQPFFLWTLFQQLRRRGFALGPAEYQAVRVALREGFGWSSRHDLREVCVALWAKSPEERAVVAALFDQHVTSDWDLNDPLSNQEAAGYEAARAAADALGPQGDDTASGAPENVAARVPPGTSPMGRLPPLGLGEAPVLPYEHVFLPQYPVNFRGVAQAWRRLRWPVREGPATELDVAATVQRRSSQGVVSPPVLRPRYRNRAKLLLLIDRHGSMTPFHSYVDEMALSISQAGRLSEVGMFYFHDTPLEGTDPSLLQPLGDQLFPSLDPILSEIPPLTEGTLMRDTALMSPVPADEVIARHGRGAAVVVISDAGAARGRYDLLRLLDTVAFLKGTKQWSRSLVWLNPLPNTAWSPSTAGELARHVPMFPMNQAGFYRAVNVLRGQPFDVERPLTAVGRPV